MITKKNRRKSMQHEISKTRMELDKAIKEAKLHQDNFIANVKFPTTKDEEITWKINMLKHIDNTCKINMLFLKLQMEMTNEVKQKTQHQRFF